MADRIVSVAKNAGPVSLRVSVTGLVRAVPQVFLYDKNDRSPTEIAGTDVVGTGDKTYNLGQPQDLADRVVTWIVTATPAGSGKVHCIMIGTFEQQGSTCSPSPFGAPDDFSDVTVLAESARVKVTA